MTPGPLALVIEDELPIRRFLRASLAANGYRVNEAGTLRDGARQAAQQPPDVIIMDLGLPDGDGVELTRQIRTWSQVPIVVLTAREMERSKIDALDAGADDYLTKPFSVAELLARLRVALRHAAARASSDPDPVYHATVDGRTLEVDLGARTVRTGIAGGSAREVRLTATEWRLLALLVKHAGKVIQHRQLLTEVWGPAHAGDLQYLRVYAGQLRRKLEADPAQPRFLQTESGVGYRLAPPGP